MKNARAGARGRRRSKPYTITCPGGKPYKADLHEAVGVILEAGGVSAYAQSLGRKRGSGASVAKRRAAKRKGRTDGRPKGATS